MIVEMAGGELGQWAVSASGAFRQVRRRGQDRVEGCVWRHPLHRRWVAC